MADLILYDTIGAPEDTASDTGSLHAKIAELRTYINTLVSTRQKPRGVVAGSLGSFSTNSSYTVTALSISGKGKLLALGFTLNYDAAWGVTIVVDGVTVYSATNGIFIGGSTTVYPAHDFYLTGGLSSSGNAKYAEIDFKSSLIIYLVSSGEYSQTVRWAYVIE